MSYLMHFVEVTSENFIDLPDEHSDLYVPAGCRC